MLQMKKNAYQTGLTLIEMMTVVAVIGILAAIAIPSFQAIIERQRIKGAAELIRDQLMVARNEAVKRSRDVTVSFATTATPTTWSFGLNDGGDCDPGTAGDCNLNVFGSQSFRGISLTTSVANAHITFDGVRGITVTPPTLTLTSANYEIRVSTTAMGRPTQCSPATAKVGGYPDC